MPDIAAHDARSAGQLPGIEATAAELLAARRPAERGAAWTLAVAQRNLALARATSADELAGWPRLPGEPWTDAETELAAWQVRMRTFEAYTRQDAARSVAAGYALDRREERAVGPLADIVGAALRRARGAITLLSGPDARAAQAARWDVLRDWPVDDRLALLGYGAHPAVVDQLLGSAD